MHTGFLVEHTSCAKHSEYIVYLLHEQDKKNKNTPIRYSITILVLMMILSWINTVVVVPPTDIFSNKYQTFDLLVIYNYTFIF